MKRISKDIFRSRNLPEPSTQVSFRVRLYFRVSRTLIVILAEKSQNDETRLRLKEKPAAQGSVRCNRVTGNLSERHWGTSGVSDVPGRWERERDSILM